MRNILTENAWRWKCGVPEKERPQRAKAMDRGTFDEIYETQKNDKFEKLREDRMALGFFRYGEMVGNSKKYNNLESAIRRLEEYQRTGNSEFLVDASNLCMIEFSQENHPNFHFESVDDGIHTNLIK